MRLISLYHITEKSLALNLGLLCVVVVVVVVVFKSRSSKPQSPSSSSVVIEFIAGQMIIFKRCRSIDDC